MACYTCEAQRRVEDTTHSNLLLIALLLPVLLLHRVSLIGLGHAAALGFDVVMTSAYSSLVKPAQ
jgi:hypothetical protein